MGGEERTDASTRILWVKVRGDSRFGESVYRGYARRIRWQRCRACVLDEQLCVARLRFVNPDPQEILSLSHFVPRFARRFLKN